MILVLLGPAILPGTDGRESGKIYVRWEAWENLTLGDGWVWAYDDTIWRDSDGTEQWRFPWSRVSNHGYFWGAS